MAPRQPLSPRIGTGEPAPARVWAYVALLLALLGLAAVLYVILR